MATTLTADELKELLRQIPYFKYLVFSSYRQGKSWYVIEISNKKGSKLFEGWYKDKFLFSDIVKIWDENIN